MKIVSVYFWFLFSLSANAQEFSAKDYSQLPIKATRTVSFNTEEASSIDVDISPDGKMLLCSFLGNIYSLPAIGGYAKQLTRGLAINRCPVWSPDGKHIAYVSDATGSIEVHVVNNSWKSHKVLDVNSYDGYAFVPHWFPDGKHIKYVNEVLDISGSNSSLLNDMGLFLGFSTDGTSRYYLQEMAGDSSAVIKFNLLTGVKSSMKVYDKPLDKLGMQNPKISPDGDRLCYIKFHTYDYFAGKSSPADSLMIVDLKTGNEKLLAHLDIKFTGYLSSQNYTFSKDSKYLFIGYGGKIHRIQIETNKNEIIPFTANIKVDMGPFNYNTFPVSLDSFQSKYIRSAQKSPDNRQLIFSALSRIYVMDLPSGKPRILVSQPFGQFQPSYSPDGKWIVYVSWSDSIGGHLWKIPSSGGKPDQITTDAGRYRYPSWSPDGNSIVVIKGENESNQRDVPDYGRVEIISVTDKNVKRFTDKVPLSNQPVFSADGQKIFFRPKKNQAYGKVLLELISLDLSSGKVTDLVYSRLNSQWGASIRQICLSPDARYSVINYNENLYLVSMANLGDSQMIFDPQGATPLIRFARSGIDPFWKENGKKLCWTNANKYNEIDPDKVMVAAAHLQPNETLQGLSQSKIIDVNIPADQTITVRLNVPRLFGNGIIVFKNASIITMRDSKVIEKGTIIIKNGRFLAVGESSKIILPKNAVVFDLHGKIIIPGFIDMHSHMGEATTPDVLRQQSWKRLLNLSYGVTTLRSPNGSFDMFGYSEIVETGQMLGSRLFQTGSAVKPPYNLTGVEEAEIVVGNFKKMGAVAIKQYMLSTRLERQLLLEASRRAGLNMTNEGIPDPLFCIGQLKDGSAGVEHNAAWGEVYKDVITTIAKSGTYLCPTLQVCKGFQSGKLYFRKVYGQDFLNRNSRFVSDDYKKQLQKEIRENKFDTGFLQQSRINARIKHAGGKIVMGSHGEDQGIGAHWEIWALQMGGLTNHEALETATITAAEALGMQKDLGSIEVGKIADLIILDKNPLEDIRNTNTIKYVMKAGVLYDSQTLDQIWPEKKKGPTVWR